MTLQKRRPHGRRVLKSRLRQKMRLKLRPKSRHGLQSRLLLKRSRKPRLANLPLLLPSSRPKRRQNRTASRPLHPNRQQSPPQGHQLQKPSRPFQLPPPRRFQRRRPWKSRLPSLQCPSHRRSRSRLPSRRCPPDSRMPLPAASLPMVLSGRPEPRLLRRPPPANSPQHRADSAHRVRLPPVNSRRPVLPRHRP